MTERLGLIVTDASPLITLGSARALSCLIVPDVPIYIPDMVYAEVTRDLAKLGAEEVIDWIRVNRGLVTIVPTRVYAEFEALLAVNPNTRSKGRGEQAALEVLSFEMAASPNMSALLLFEDSDVRARGFVRVLPARVTAMSTGDFLCELERAGRIQSADHILDEAASSGRNVDAQRRPVDEEAAGSPLRTHLEQREEPRGAG